MKIKTKLSIGVGSLFIVILIVLGLSTYFIHQLAHDAGAVIEDNQITLDYVQSMQQSINKIHVKVIGNSQKNIANNMVSSFEKNLSTQKDNVTERGEKEATENVRKHFAAYKNLYITSSKNTSIDSANYYYSKINEELNYIYKLNRDAIVKKNNKAVDTATTGINLVSLVGTLLLIGAFTFVLNFPGYIANPIRELSEKIRGIADKNFNQRLDFSANDEFGDLAESFNYMAKQLNDFQKSTLADILVEKKRIESIVNNLDEGIILLDANQHVIVANPTIGKLMDLQTEELLGKQVQEISKQNDLFKAITSNIESAKKKHDPLHITVDKEENFYQKHVHAVYTYDDWAKKNNLSGYVIFLKNITEFKKLDIAKTNFLATVSHELKTPLSSINLSLKLLNDKRVGELSSEQTHLLNNIHHESKRLLRYVNELLDFSRVESGNIKLTTKKSSPLQIINFSINAMKPTLEQANVKAMVDAAENLPEVLSDIEKTVWVLTNLIGNAVRYSPPNSTIFLRAEKRYNEVVFTVEDQGSGIDPKYHSRIFEKFVQVNESTKPGGTGLGLAIAKDFIEAQNGKIWIESELGSGSKFRFSLLSDSE